MSFILLGILNAQASGGAFTYWLATLGGAGNDISRSLVIEASGNSYECGITDSTGAGGNDVLLAKRDSTGTVEWQRTLGGSGSDDGRGIGIDASGNVYVTAITTSAGAGGNDFLTAKYNSSGTIQWQRILGGSGTDNGRGIGVDASGNVYVTGSTSSEGAGSVDLVLAKYNSGGTIQWQRIFGGGSAEVAISLAFDSSDNIYVLGLTQSSGAGDFDFLLAKYNSSGTIQWQRTLGGTGNDQGYAVAIDSSDNLYIVGQSTSDGITKVLLAKYNSSGTIQWQRVLGGTGQNEGRGIAVDSLDNVYVTATTDEAGAGSDDFGIVKYNSSGTIQWQRVLGGTGAEAGWAVAIDSSDNLYVVGQTSSTGAGGVDSLLAKLPSDGSLTGTYVLDGVNIVYAASSLTAATSTFTSSTSSLTAATSTLTSATSTLTDAGASLTNHFVGIPA